MCLILCFGVFLCDQGQQQSRFELWRDADASSCAGPVLEAGLGAVAGGAAQATALKSSAAGEPRGNNTSDRESLIWNGALLAAFDAPTVASLQEHLKVHLNACHLAGDSR